MNQTQPAPVSINAILDQISHSVLITDRDGRITYVNPAFEHSTGYSSSEVLGKTPRILKSGVHPNSFYSELWNILLRGSPVEYRFTNRKKDGELYEETVWITPLVGADNKITGYVSLRKSEGQNTYDVFKLMTENAPLGVYVCQNDRFTFVNNRFEALTGYSADWLKGKAWSDLVLPEDLPHAQEARQRALTDKSSDTLAYRVIRADGVTRWFGENPRTVALTSSDGTPEQYQIGTVSDLTRRMTAEQGLSQALSYYTATMDTASDGIVVTTLQHQLVYANRAFQTLWDIPRELNPGEDSNDWLQYVLPKIKDRDSYQGFVHEIYETKKERRRLVELLDGRVIVLFSRPCMVEEEVVGRVWSYMDITEEIGHQAELRRLANYDSLTGMYNRRHFQERLEEEVTVTRMLGGNAALVILDIDRFKDVNDTSGHVVGDAVLAQIADVIQSRVAGYLSGRLGGDEFALYIRDTDRSSALSFVGKLTEELRSETFVIAGHPGHITVSAGIAMQPEDGTTTQELMAHADRAMYDAKFAGRDRITSYNHQTHISIPFSRRYDWEHRINQALESDRLRLYAQPIVSLRDGTIETYETLLRLQNPDGSVTEAKEFVPIAEELGLIRRLDEWALAEVSNLLGETGKAGARFRLALNLSGRSFADPAALANFREALTQSRTDVSRLTVEITETAALANINRAKRFLEGLRNMGCQIALDDFGVGYSSFFNLKNLPVDVVKVDGSFITDIHRDAASRQIVHGIATVARGLGIRTVAEFVTSAEILEEVRKAGIDAVQGYYVGRPRPIVETLQSHDANGSFAA